MTIFDEKLLVDKINSIHFQILHEPEKFKINFRDVEIYSNRLAVFQNGFQFGEVNSGAMKFDRAAGVVTIGREGAQKISDCFQSADSESIETALLLYGLHEAFHIAQNIGYHPDIKLLKETIGPWYIAYMDLKSNIIATNVLCEFALESENSNKTTEKAYLAMFSRLWIGLLHKTFDAFPIYHNPEKCRRFFGHLLLSSVMLEFEQYMTPSFVRAPLWPSWSIDLDLITIMDGEMNVFVAPQRIEKLKLKNIITNLYEGNIDESFSAIRKLVVQLSIESALRDA